jgi:electron transfer flavoprotein alpha/beta subunit
MEGGRKPTHELSSADLGADLTPKRKDVSLKGFVMRRRNIIHKDMSVEEAVKSTVSALRKDGVL